MTFIQMEAYFYLVIVILFCVNYSILKCGIYKKLRIEKPILISFVYTGTYLLVVVLNLLFVFPTLNRMIDGYEMNWFDLRGIMLFFIVGLIMLAPLHLLIINKILPVVGVKPTTLLLILYSTNTAVLLLHQKIYLLLK
jgi:hypothetical protein